MVQQEVQQEVQQNEAVFKQDLQLQQQSRPLELWFLLNDGHVLLDCLLNHGLYRLVLRSPARSNLLAWVHRCHT